MSVPNKQIGWGVEENLLQFITKQLDRLIAVTSKISGGGGGSGTVTSFTFTNGAGFTGTVTNSTTAPTLSLVLATGGDLSGSFPNPTVSKILGNTIPANAAGVLTNNGAGVLSWTPSGGTGTVTSVSFTGGLISVATPTTTPAFTVAGTSGGIPYFSSTSTWATSALLAANAIVIGGGAGTAPSTTTTGTGVLTALGVNTGTAGSFVVNGGALGTPSSGTLTSATGLPISTGLTGLGAANRIPFASSTTALTTSANFTFDGTTLILGAAAVIGTETWSFQQTGNAERFMLIANSTAAGGSRAGYKATSTSNLSTFTAFESVSSSFTTSGMLVANTGVLYTSAMAGGLNIGTLSSAQMSIWTNNTQRFTVDANGSVVTAIAALSTSATDGFLYVTTGAGAPTGVPTTKTGTIPLYFDTTNNFLYFYNSGWKKSTVYA